MTMFIRRLHNLPILCLLILCLLSSTASTSGYVWCVSSDGHATLEGAVAGDCGLDNPTPATNGITSTSLSIGTDDCGPCLDVSPSHQWGSPRPRHDGCPVSVPAEFAPVAIVAYTSLPVRSQTSHPVAAPTPRTPEPILHHRTIVLLI
jgi:hypothetical protein